MKKIILFIVFFWCVFTYSLFNIFANKRSNNLIESITISKHRIDIVPNKEFKQKYLVDDFWVEYGEDIDLTKLDYSIVTMPFIMYVISTVWISGEKYYIDAMDEKLHESLKVVRKVFKRMYPHTPWNGELVPKKLVKSSYTERGEYEAAIPFSGGLDSTCSSCSHSNEKQLLITIWGHFNTPLDEPDNWKLTRQRVVSFARKYGHGNAFVRSNFYNILNRPYMNAISPEIIAWGHSAIGGLAEIGLVSPILVAKKCPLLYTPSSISRYCPYPFGFNPFVHNNISFANVKVRHDQFQLSRAEKCEFLSDHCKKNNIEELSVHVCQQGSSNCCKCVKCLATIQGFLAANLDHQRYGFPVAKSQAIERTKEYFRKNRLFYSQLCFFRGIQKRLQERVDEGEKLEPHLLWLLSLNLNKDILDPRKYKTTIDWRQLRDEFPDTPSIEPKLNDLSSGVTKMFSLRGSYRT